MKVLVVEDEEATRLIFSKVAHKEGHVVKTAADGQEGLALFAEFQPDLVLSDIQMPKMDGLELLERIRKINDHALFIIISSMDTPQYILKALRLRANDYLKKPVAVEELAPLLAKYEDIHQTRSIEREVIGLVFRRDLGLSLPNDFAIVGKAVDRLMQETEFSIPPAQRLGIHLGLVEIITNAIEHGNLEITYAEKSDALNNYPEAWESLVKKRLSSPTYASRKVLVEFKMDSNACEWLITDQGSGFDWRAVPDPNDPENLLKSHGRGIMLTKLQFDECSYLGKGNRVRLVKKVGA